MKTKDVTEESVINSYDPGFSQRNKKGQWKAGITPWNKGMSDFRPSPETEFKNGQYVGKNHPSWKGGIQKTTHDCTYLWNGNGKRIRRPKAIWESVHGKMPQGLVIYHKDGDKDNDDIENLEAISRAELLRRNTKRKKHDN